MSYLVLARKWRPRRFAELVGQEHVVRALTNALEANRVHHAFLFTGTRGVGKTTIARIFAKSLNCERGIGAEPCGECGACTDIDAGRFMDLLEIDAASNTGVDDVRELIDNAQYMPSRGRVKVYLIDEVHMLSKAAFNALLKTLEEPPGHVKFLLATTDPQKLPVTVLSRCLQFNLKRLSEEQIAGQIRHILQAEQLPFEDAGIALLARAADGSLRDGLSLLDQAIAYTSATLDQAGIAAMLGTVDRNQVAGLLRALDAADGPALMAVVADMATYSPDYGAVLDALASALHRVQLAQLVPGSMADTMDVPVTELAASLPADLVQLWYQIAISGRRELPLAPSPLVGFEMCLLRMLAFRPDETPAAGSRPAPALPASATGISGPRAVPAASHAAASSPPIAQPPQPAAQVREAAPVAAAPKPVPAATAATLTSAEQWLDVIEQAGLRGPVRELAAHAAFVDYQPPLLQLTLPQGMDYLHSDAMLDSLSAALAPALGQRPQIRFQIGAAAPSDTLHQRRAREREQRQSDAESGFMADPAVQHLVNAYGARVLPDSIRPLKEN
jgi:DNA polymerase-3 subunit gamma/tau